MGSLRTVRQCTLYHGWLRLQLDRPYLNQVRMWLQSECLCSPACLLRGRCFIRGWCRADDGCLKQVIKIKSLTQNSCPQDRRRWNGSPRGGSWQGKQCPDAGMAPALTMEFHLRVDTPSQSPREDVSLNLDVIWIKIMYFWKLATSLILLDSQKQSIGQSKFSENRFYTFQDKNEWMHTVAKASVQRRWLLKHSVPGSFLGRDRALLSGQLTFQKWR